MATVAAQLKQSTLQCFFQPKPADDPAAGASPAVSTPLSGAPRLVASEERSAAPTMAGGAKRKATEPVEGGKAPPKLAGRKLPAGKEPAPRDASAAAPPKKAPAKRAPKKRVAQPAADGEEREPCAVERLPKAKTQGRAKKLAASKAAASSAAAPLGERAQPGAPAAAELAPTEPMEVCGAQPAPAQQAAPAAAAAAPAAEPAKAPAAAARAGGEARAAERRPAPRPAARRPRHSGSDAEASASSSDDEGEGESEEGGGGSSDPSASDGDGSGSEAESDSGSDGDWRAQPRKRSKGAAAHRAEPSGAAPPPEALSEYEQQRLANIAANEVLLKQLGLLGSAASRQPGAAAGRGAGAARRALPRVPRERAELAEPAKRSARVRGEAAPELDLDSVPRMARPEREARQAPQDVQLSEAQLAALASAGGARWFVAFSEWMGRGHSAANARSVCATLHRLAAGLGVQHRSHPSQTFLEGEPVGLGADVPALKQRAREWLRKVGPDTSGGWLIAHPLSKLWLYQQTLAQADHGADGADGADGGAADGADAPASAAPATHAASGEQGAAPAADAPAAPAAAEAMAPAEADAHAEAMAPSEADAPTAAEAAVAAPAANGQDGTSEAERGAPVLAGLSSPLARTCAPAAAPLSPLRVDTQGAHAAGAPCGPDALSAPN